MKLNVTVKIVYIYTYKEEKDGIPKRVFSFRIVRSTIRKTRGKIVAKKTPSTKQLLSAFIKEIDFGYFRALYICLICL